MPAFVIRDAKSRSSWLLALAFVVTALVAAQQHYRVTLALQDPATAGPINDFDRWMLMTPKFLHGRAEYVDDHLPTPPLSLMVFAPFTALSRQNAQFVWVCVKLPLALLTFLLCARIVARAGIRFSATALVLIAACWALAVVLDMQEGQVNFLALLPLVAGLSVVQEDTRASDALAGFLIGLGVAVKVTPVIFLAYFLWKRRWIVAAAGAASVVVWLVFVPALAFGWSQNLRWLEQWTRIMIVPYVAQGKVVYSTTQSVGSFALRLLSPLPAFEIHRNDIFEYGYMNVTALSGVAVQRIVRALMLVVGAAGLVWARRPLRELKSQRYVLEIGAVAAFMLWFSERTWVHHYVSFIVTLSAAGMVLSDPAVPESSKLWLRRALIVFAGATIFASEAGRVFGPHGVEWAKAVGVFLWPSVFVIVATLRAAMRREEGQTRAAFTLETVSTPVL